MSKGIDYSKFDHIGDSDEEEEKEEETPNERKGKEIFRETYNKEDQQGEKKTSKAAKLSACKDSAMCCKLVM